MNGDREASFKDYYRETLDANGIKQLAEARKLQISQPHVSNFMNTLSPYYMGVHHVPDSTIKNDIMAWLSEQCGGSFVTHTGKLNGTIRDEMAGILKALAKITECEDNKCTEKQSDIIIELAKRMKAEVKK